MQMILNSTLTALNKTPNTHNMLLLKINQMTITIKMIAQNRGHSHNLSVLSSVGKNYVFFFLKSSSTHCKV